MGWEKVEGGKKRRRNEGSEGFIYEVKGSL